jgi:hypothetical protein
MDEKALGRFFIYKIVNPGGLGYRITMLFRQASGSLFLRRRAQHPHYCMTKQLKRHFVSDGLTASYRNLTRIVISFG